MPNDAPQPRRRVHNVFQLHCTICNKICANQSGLTQHENSMHPKLPLVDDPRLQARQDHPEPLDEPVQNHPEPMEGDGGVPGPDIEREAERGLEHGMDQEQDRGIKIDHDLLNGTPPEIHNMALIPISTTE